MTLKEQVESNLDIIFDNPEHHRRMIELSRKMVKTEFVSDGIPGFTWEPEKTVGGYVHNLELPMEYAEGAD